LSHDRVLTDRLDGATGKKDFQLPGRRTASRRAVPGRGQILVAGFHRSGTSLTAQLLRSSGVFLGYDMLLQNRSQPQGHFEDREIKKLHDEILADNGLTWQVEDGPLPVVGDNHRKSMREIVERREADRRLWGFKDPRVCLFLNAWKVLLPDARILLVYRHFAEVTRSLHRRAANGILRGIGRQDHHRRFWEVPDLALKMWLAHNEALIDFARAYPEDVLAVSFDMLRRGFPLLGALNRYWALTLVQTPTSDVFLPRASGEPLGTQLVSEERLIGETLETWAALERLGRRTGELIGIPTETGEPATEEAFYLPTDAYASEVRKEFAEFELRYLQEQLEEAENLRKSLEAKLKKSDASQRFG
jgi:hypothetical protein